MFHYKIYVRANFWSYIYLGIRMYLQLAQKYDLTSVTYWHMSITMMLITKVFGVLVTPS